MSKEPEIELTEVQSQESQSLLNANKKKGLPHSQYPGRDMGHEKDREVFAHALQKELIERSSQEVPFVKKNIILLLENIKNHYNSEKTKSAEVLLKQIEQIKNRVIKAEPYIEFNDAGNGPIKVQPSYLTYAQLNQAGLWKLLNDIVPVDESAQQPKINDKRIINEIKFLRSGYEEYKKLLNKGVDRFIDKEMSAHTKAIASNDSMKDSILVFATYGFVPLVVGVLAALAAWPLVGAFTFAIGIEILIGLVTTAACVFCMFGLGRYNQDKSLKDEVNTNIFTVNKLSPTNLLLAYQGIAPRSGTALTRKKEEREMYKTYEKLKAKDQSNLSTKEKSFMMTWEIYFQARGRHENSKIKERITADFKYDELKNHYDILVDNYFKLGNLIEKYKDSESGIIDWVLVFGAAKDQRINLDKIINGAAQYTTDNSSAFHSYKGFKDSQFNSLKENWVNLVKKPQEGQEQAL